MGQVQDILYSLHDIYKLSDGNIAKKIGVSASYIGRVRRGKKAGYNLLGPLSDYLTEVEQRPVQAPVQQLSPVSQKPSLFRQRPVFQRPVSSQRPLSRPDLPSTQNPASRSLAQRAMDAANIMLKKYHDMGTLIFSEPVSLPESTASPEPVASSLPEQEEPQTEEPKHAAPSPVERDPVAQSEPETEEAPVEELEMNPPEPVAFFLNVWTFGIAMLAIFLLLCVLPTRPVREEAASEPDTGPLEPLASVQALRSSYSPILSLEDYLR